MIPLSDVKALLRDTNADREEGWAELLIDRVKAYPKWREIMVDPRKGLDPASLYFEDDDAAAVEEYAARGVKNMPPIVLIPSSGEYPWEIIDGAHRAAAARKKRAKIAALVPALASNPPFAFSFEREVGPGMKGLVLADDSCIAWKVNAETGSPHHEDIKEEQDLEGHTKFDLSMRTDRSISWLGIDGGISIDQKIPNVLRYFRDYKQTDIIELNLWLLSFDLELRTGDKVMTVREFEEWRTKNPRPKMVDDDAKDEKLQSKWVRSFDKAVEEASANSAKGYARDIREFHESDNPPPSVFWGRAGAGVLLHCRYDDTYLLVRRSQDVEQPGTWGIPGGACGKGGFYEDSEGRAIPTGVAWKCAKREAIEELSWFPTRLGAKLPIVYQKQKFRYTTFVVDIGRDEAQDANAAIDLNWENDKFEWFTLAEMAALGEKLHFGVQYVLEYLRANG